MIPDWLTIFPGLAARSFRDSAIQLELARNHRLGEIPFADKIRHDVNALDRCQIEKKERIAQTRLLFPKSALHIRENVSLPNICGVGQRRRVRVRVHGRTMTDDQKSAIGPGNHVERSTSKVYFSNE